MGKQHSTGLCIASCFARRRTNNVWLIIATEHEANLTSGDTSQTYAANRYDRRCGEGIRAGGRVFSAGARPPYLPRPLYAATG